MTVNSLDFVLLFMPVEAAFSVAVQQDGGLFTDAFEKNIILVKGGVAGSNDGLIVIKPSVKLALRAAHKAKNTRK
jgi:DNA anti-recombination protein RmuC